MANNQLIVLEQQLKPLVPSFREVLGNRMPVERLTRTVLVSVERLPRLLECDRQSLFNAAMSAAVLGLEVDGVTGQAFLIPFKEKAQLVIGYKGYNTLGARSGYTVTGAVVREGDEFQYELGTRAFIRHRPAGDSGRRIVSAWATATSNTLPPIISVLSIDEIMDIKARSPGARKTDSPWNDPNIGFPAMSEKSAKRRLARSMPLNILQLAARLDEAYDEQGKAAWIDPVRGLQIEPDIVQTEASPTPSLDEILNPPKTPLGGSGIPAGYVTPPSGDAGRLSLEDMAREAAARGRDVFKTFWNNRTPEERVVVEAMEEELVKLMGPKQ
jgi:recombination protein RecT